MRVRSIQPDFTDDILEANQEVVTSRHTLNDLRAVIAHWCMLQDNLPDGFADTFRITSAARQVVPAVVIRAQRSSRTLVSNLIPFDGTPLSNRRFDSRNLFALSHITNRCEFPDGCNEKRIGADSGQRRTRSLQQLRRCWRKPLQNMRRGRNAELRCLSKCRAGRMWSLSRSGSDFDWWN